jgi:hypothetical protein
VPVEGPLALTIENTGRQNNAVSNFSGALQLMTITSTNSPVLTCRAFQKTYAKLFVVNNSGQFVRIISTIIEKGMNNMPLEMPLLPAGIYNIYAFTPKGPSNVLRFVYIK